MSTNNATARLVAIVNMLSSEHEGERNNAAGMVRRMAETARKPVCDMLRDALGTGSSRPDENLHIALNSAKLDKELLRVELNSAQHGIRMLRSELADARHERDVSRADGVRMRREIDQLKASLAAHRAAHDGRVAEEARAAPQQEQVRVNRYRAAFNHPNVGRLSASDTGFLRNNLNKTYISPAQERWLSDIERRLGGETVARPAARPAPTDDPWQGAQTQAERAQAAARRDAEAQATAFANIDTSGACPF